MKNRLNVAFVLIDAALGIVGLKTMDDILDREFDINYADMDANYAIVRDIEDFA